jgi:O-antigen/teichoic acid export membrane protein
VLVAFVAGRRVLTIVYRPEYGAHSALFVWLMIAAAIAYVAAVLGYAANATRAYRLLTMPYAAATVVTLICCWLFVPRYGLVGAAWAVALSGIAGCVAPWWVIVRAAGRPSSSLDLSVIEPQREQQDEPFAPKAIR